MEGVSVTSVCGKNAFERLTVFEVGNALDLQRGDGGLNLQQFADGLGGEARRDVLPRRGDAQTVFAQQPIQRAVQIALRKLRTEVKGDKDIFNGHRFIVGQTKPIDGDDLRSGLDV